MRIDAITLESFRNYSNSGAEFSPSVNIISGQNANGKTNLLEAIYLVSAGKSFRTRFDREMISFGSDYSYVTARGFSGGRDKVAEITLRARAKKLMKLNGVKLKSTAGLSESFACVLFCPEDLGLIRDGASQRRRLMDMCISQLRPKYASVLSDFNRVYESKTRILRDGAAAPSLYNLLEEYDDALARLSAEIIHLRALFVKRLAPEAARIHGEFTGGEELSIGYKTVRTVTDPEKPARELYDEIMVHQREHAEAERASRLCLTGAHKDDLVIEIAGRDARTFASQGQTRTAVLSIKLAEREIIRTARGEYPILLLDDVLSELDSSRQNFVLNKIGDGQVFITCCEDRDIIAGKTGGRLFEVESGVITGVS